MANRIGCFVTCRKCEYEQELNTQYPESDDCPLCGYGPVRVYPKVQCGCGRALICWDSWANACQCGQEFNGSGQALAPRSHWGEETGETFAANNWSNDT